MDMNAQANIFSPDLNRRRFTPAPFPARALARPPVAPEPIVTLASLSARIADRFIAETFSEALHTQTGRSVLLISLEAGAARFSLRDWDQTVVNGEFALARHLEPVQYHVSRVRLHISGDPSEAAAITPLVRHCARHFQHVVIHASEVTPVPLLLECLAVSSRTFLLLQPAEEDLYHRNLLFREVRALPEAEHLNLRTIICREKGEEHFNELLKQMGASVHGFLHGCPPASAAHSLRYWHDKNFNADIRRLAREVGHCRVGLALSSGGARGLAHIGVIQVFEEHGIDVDVVVGCSMGSYIGAVWAYGYDGVQMEKLAREFEHRWGLFELIDPFILPRQGFLRGEKVKRRLKRSIGDVHFSELVRPLRIVATNLLTLERIVFSSGEVAAAVHASSAIPGACVPVKLGDELYIDGGIADPLPVDVLEEMGIERIIAVNTIPTPAYLRCRVERDRERMAQRGARPRKLRQSLNHYLNYFAPGNILDTILRSFNCAQMRVAEESCLHADVVLRPLSFDGRWHDFRHPGKYIAIGRREAEERLEEVKALINRKEPIHETNTVDHAMAGLA